MPTLVEMPDGTEIEFPDGMSMSDIQVTVARQMRKQQGMGGLKQYVPAAKPQQPAGPQPFDWNRPVVDYGDKQPTADELLASGAPITHEQFLSGQGRLSSTSQLDELRGRVLSIGNKAVPGQQALPLWQDHYAKQGEDPIEYMADRVGFSPTGYARAYNLRKATERMQAGVATAFDVSVIAQAQRAAEIEAEKGVGRKAFDIATAMPAYALETMATGGGAVLAKAGAGASAKVIGKTLLKNAGTAAKVGGRTAFFTPRTYAEAQERMANGDGYVSAHAKAFAGQTIDRATELIGGALPVPKKLEAVGEALKNAWVKRTGLNPSAYKETLARIGVNGVVGELMEERFAEIARGMSVDNNFGVTGQLLTGEFEAAGEQLLAEMLAAGGVQGAMSAASMTTTPKIGTKAAQQQRATEIYPGEPGPVQPTQEELTRQRKTFQQVRDAEFGPTQPVTNDELQSMSASQIAEQFGYRKGRRKQWMIDQIMARPENQVAQPETAESQDGTPIEIVQDAPELIDPQDAEYEYVRSQMADALPEAKPDRRGDFKAMEPASFFDAHPDAIEAVAALSDSPSRKQFANAVGIPTSTIGSRQAIDAFIQEARGRVTQPVPAQETVQPETPAEVPQEPAQATQAAFQNAYDQLPSDVESLTGLASMFGVPIPKRGTKARKELNAEELRTQVAQAMTTRPAGQFKEVQAEKPSVRIDPKEIDQGPVDTSEFEGQPSYQSPKPFSAEAGKGVWVPLEKKGKASAPLASRIKKKGKKEEFALSRQPKQEWQGDKQIEDTRGTGKQKTFISGIGKDLPGQRVMIDVDFEGEADPVSPPPKTAVAQAEPENATIAVEKILDDLRKGGHKAKAVEPTTELQRDIVGFAQMFGLQATFFESSARAAGKSRANVIALNAKTTERKTEDYVWGIAGHEVAHSTGIDQLTEEFGKDIVEQYAKEYYDKATKDVRERLDRNRETYLREGVATLVENFMRDPKFRSKLKAEQTPVWGRVVDKLWEPLSGLSPKSKAMKTAIEVLKRARATEVYRENKIMEVARDTVREYGPEENAEQMVADFADMIRSAHRDKVHLWKLRERAKTETKRALGLNTRIAASIENRGKDLSSVKKIDTIGRTLVNEYQELFPGDSEYQDYERIAWDLASEPKFDNPPDITQDLVDEVWMQLTGGQDMRGDAKGDAWEPDDDQKKEWEDIGFDLFAFDEDPTLEANKEVQRAFGRANPATTLAGRLEVMRENLEHNAPLRRPRMVAEQAARKRLEGQGAAKERDAFVARFKGGNFNPLSEVDTVVLGKLINMTSLSGALARGTDALSDLHVMVNGWALSRSEQARALGLRDPIARGVPLSQEARNNRALTDILITGVGMDNPSKGGNGPGGSGVGTPEQMAKIQELIDLLKKHGIDVLNKDTLKNDEQIMKALGIAKAHRDRASGGWRHWTDMIYEYYLNSILSGPQTHVANAIGNAINSPMINMIERTVEVAISKATRGRLSDDKQVRDFRELGEMYKAMLPAVMVGMKNAVVAFRTEYSPLNLYTGDPGGLMSVMAPSYKIPGKIGRVIRIPFRMLAASDEFARTINAHGAAAIHAYRLGKRNGVAQADMPEYVHKHVADYTSPVWHAAMQDAAYAAFQQDGGPFAREMKRLANEVKNSRYLPLSVAGRALFPFSTFMINSFSRAADLIPGLGAVIAVMNSRDPNTAVNWNRVVGNQIIALGVFAAVGAALASDDDEEYPRLTGTKERNVAKRGLQYLTAPPMSIRIGDKYYSYARIEPINTVLAAIVDFLEKGDQDATASEQAFISIMGQLNDKNYTQGIEDIIRVMNQEQSAYDIPAKTLAGFVPNVYRQPVRESRNIVTESRFRYGDTLPEKGRKLAMQTEIPGIEASYRYDIWGNEMRTNAYNTSVPYRILSPVKVKDTKDVFPASLALMKWNENPDNDPYYPELPDRAVKYKGKEITNEQYSEYVKEAGEIARKVAEKRKYPDVPTQADITFIKQALEYGRKVAKYRLMERLKANER